MKRRTFITNGVAFGVAGLSCRSDETSNAYQGSSVLQMLQTGMIWTATGVSVKLAGPPVPIASGASHGPVVDSDEHVVFFRSVVLHTLPLQADLHLFSYTRYRLYINGQYAGRGPSRFQNECPEYDTRDLTSFFRPGSNAISVLVHRDAPTGRIMSHTPGFAAVLETRDLNGKSQYLTTDESWKAAPDLSFGPRRQAWASIEENVDARAVQSWLTPDFAARQWEAAVFASETNQTSLRPRATPLQSETTQPWVANAPGLPLRITAPAELNLAVRKIMQAYHVLEFNATEGTRIETTYHLPEKPDSGSSTYLARVGKQIWMGGDSFCFNRLSLRVTSGSLTLTRAEAVEVRYPFERVGRFTSSDSMLDDLWEICARTLEILSEDSYVDCSDRERVEWMDNSPPAFDCTRVMMAGPREDGGKLWSDPRLMQQLLRRTALTQQPDGQMKAHTCSERWDIHAIMEDRSCDWVNGARQYYDCTGDANLIRELWPPMVRLLNWFLEQRTTRGLVQAREWEVWDNPLRYQICEGAGLNALLYQALRNAAFLGGIIGAVTESEAFAAAATQLSSDFNRLLWDDLTGAYSGALFGTTSKINTRESPPIGSKLNNGVYVPTVQAALLCLSSGIVPAARLQRLRQFVLKHQADVTGVMSHYFLFKALYEMDRPELDEHVLTRMRVGWKAQVESEWQTTWEDLTGGSKVHIYGMHPAYWLSTFVLGVRVKGPAADRALLIEPRCGELTHCEGVVVTEFGPVPIKWTRDAMSRLRLDFTVPDGLRATVRMRKQDSEPRLLVDGQISEELAGETLSIELGAGRHTVAHVL